MRNIHTVWYPFTVEDRDNKTRPGHTTCGLSIGDAIIEEMPYCDDEICRECLRKEPDPKERFKDHMVVSAVRFRNKGWYI